MLSSSGLPQNLWREAILSANYILNKVSRKKVNQTSYELWHGRVPSYKYLKVWGCQAKVAIPSPKKTKIGPKTIDCIFIGYAKNSSAYRIMIHKSEHTEMYLNTIIESRNASFFEHVFPNKTGQETSSNKRSHDAITSQD